MFTKSFLILAAIILISGLIILRADRAHKAQVANFSADDVKTFNERFRFKSRAEMPSRFADLATTSDRLRRTSTIGLLAVIAGIAYIIIAGPSV